MSLDAAIQRQRHEIEDLRVEIRRLESALSTRTQERDAAVTREQDLEDSAAQMRADVEALRQERDEARTFGEKAAQQYNELLEAYSRVTCAFCGEEFPRGTPRHGDGRLAEHIKTCPKHPLREAEAQCAALEKARDEAVSVLSLLSSWLGQGLGDEVSSTPSEFDQRIRGGVDSHVAVASEIRLREGTHAIRAERDALQATVQRVREATTMVLRLVGKNIRVHGNGFIQVDLTDRVRLHVWGDPRIPRQQVDTQIHDHTFGFTSHVLVGSLRQVSYEISECEGAFYVPHVATVHQGEDTRLAATSHRLRLRELHRFNIHAGESYSMKAGEIHETVPLGLAVSVIVKDGPSLAQGGSSPTVFVREGLSPDNGFNRYSYRDDVLWDIVSAALTLVPQGAPPQAICSRCHGKGRVFVGYPHYDDELPSREVSAHPHQRSQGQTPVAAQSATDWSGESWGNGPATVVAESGKSLGKMASPHGLETARCGMCRPRFDASLYRIGD